VTLPQFLIYAGAFVLVIFSVVLVHEAGHFVLAKLSGIRVDEFAVGFGPKLFSWRRGETLYALRVIPMGGFVRMAGMLGIGGETDAGERNFYRATIPRRFATVAAGVVSNFIFAALCFTVVNIVASSPWGTVSGGPARSAGIPNGARITSLDGRAVRDDTLDNVTHDLHSATIASHGRPVQVTYETASGATRSAVVTPALVIIVPRTASSPAQQILVTEIDSRPVATGDPRALLGSGSTVRVLGYVERSDGTVGTQVTERSLSGVVDGYGEVPGKAQASWRLGVQAGFDGQPFPEAVANGVVAIPSFVHDTAAALYELATDPSLGGVTGPNGLSGPVGIAEATATASQQGFLSDRGLLWWIGFISMNLGLINVLPIPFLDGGRLFLLGIEAVRRRRLDPRHEAIAIAVGLALVVLFVIYVTIGDVGRIGKPQ